ncbi:MAG: mandelate racemase/muconate lactonizing enzyme family protein [Woeseia sp.]
MKIAKVTAYPLNVGMKFDTGGKAHESSLSMCLVQIETDDGLTGTGMTAITEEEVIAAIVERVAAPALVGEDPLATERIWEKLYWLLAPRGQGGYACHAIAAIDIALWDLKGKVLEQPLWRLLGGARSRVPTYTTFGFPFYDRDALVAAAKRAISSGSNRLKMVVGHGALKRRDEPRAVESVIEEDIRRVALVRDAVGEEVALFVDANCNLDPFNAAKLANRLEPYDISFFEEPVTQNDARALADLRQRTTIPLAGGQNEGLAYRFREFLVAKALDVLQPNVTITGGYTQCLKIAGMAHAFNTGIDNGGAWPHHNMHLHGGVMNGGMVEYHLGAVECCRQVFGDLPVSVGGWLDLPDSPGLGFDVDLDAVRELAKRPNAAGKGKGG